MTLLYLDIETLPSNDPELIAEMSSAITAPGSYKKQESIDAWLAENRESALKDLLAKTSFDGLFGRIACICWAFDDEPIGHATKPADDERTMLANFYASVAENADIGFHGGSTSSAVTIVGHNVAGFDLPFLKHRSMIHGIRPHGTIMRAMNAKPWGSEIADTMLLWSSDRERKASMDKLCRAFGIAGKGDFNGSMVADTWPTDPQKVIDYCMSDVERTRLIYKRLTFQQAA